MAMTAAFPNILTKLRSLISRTSALENTTVPDVRSIAVAASSGLAGKAPTSHAASVTTYGAGTSALYGHVKLSDAVNSSMNAASAVAATPAAISSVYALASGGSATAVSAMPKSGGTFTGAVAFNKGATFSSGTTFSAAATFSGGAVVPAGTNLVLDISSSATAIGTPVAYPIRLKYKNTGGGVFAHNPLYLIPSADSGNYGVGFIIDAGGALVLGAGEAGRTYVSNSQIDGGTPEPAYLVSDHNIYFVTNLQSGYTSRKEMTFNTAGNLVLPAGATVNAAKFTGVAASATNDTSGHAILTYVKSLNISGGNLVMTNGSGTVSSKTIAAATATKLATARKFRAHLDSTSAVAFDGTSACALGVTGILPVANGGTGNAKGRGPVSSKSTRTSDGTWNITGLTVGLPVFIIFQQTSSKNDTACNVRVISGALTDTPSNSWFGLGTDDPIDGWRHNCLIFIPTATTLSLKIKYLEDDGGKLHAFQ